MMAASWVSEYSRSPSRRRPSPSSGASTYHVALYLGGGQFIEAPHTGAYVRYNSIYNWYPDFVARP